MTYERMKDLLTIAIDIADNDCGADGYLFWRYLTNGLCITREEFAELKGEEYAHNMYDDEEEED